MVRQDGVLPCARACPLAQKLTIRTQCLWKRHLLLLGFKLPMPITACRGGWIPAHIAFPIQHVPRPLRSSFFASRIFGKSLSWAQLLIFLVLYTSLCSFPSSRLLLLLSWSQKSLFPLRVMTIVLQVSHDFSLLIIGCLPSHSPFFLLKTTSDQFCWKLRRHT